MPLPARTMSARIIGPSCHLWLRCQAGMSGKGPPWGAMAWSTNRMVKGRAVLYRTAFTRWDTLGFREYCAMTGADSGVDRVFSLFLIAEGVRSDCIQVFRSVNSSSVIRPSCRAFCMRCMFSLAFGSVGVMSVIILPAGSVQQLIPPPQSTLFPRFQNRISVSKNITDFQSRSILMMYSFTPGLKITSCLISLVTTVPPTHGDAASWAN